MKSKEEFYEYINKERRKNIYITIFLFVSIIIASYFMLENFDNKQKLKQSKIVIDSVLTEYKEMLQYRSKERDSLIKQLDFTKQKIKTAEDRIKQLNNQDNTITQNIHDVDSVYNQLTNYQSSKLDKINRSTIGIYFDKNDKSMVSKATSLKRYLKNYGVEGEIKLYPKNKSFFKKVGNPRGNEIRYEPKTERSLAFDVKGVLYGYRKGVDFELRPVINSTPNFISIFLNDI